jgi:hypothetical protein
MRRQITLLPSEQEGLCYDLQRAESEGLYEEMQIRNNGTALRISDELFEEMLNSTDLSVNVSPNEVQELRLTVTYVYSYGKA